MKKRTLALMLSAALCVGMLAGCGGGTTTTPESPAANTESQAPASQAPESESPAAEQLTGTVNTNGSTSMESVMGYLTEGFAEVQPGVTVNYTGSGSGAGVTGAQDGTCDIGLASRDLHDDETGVTQITVAKDGIAIIVNPNNPVADLSIEQIAQIFTGEITNWSELGGEDGQIVPIGRGYASLSAVDETVKALTVGGVAPTEETVLDGTYAIQRNFNFIISESTELSPAAQAFVDWATSTDAADLIASAGAVPVAE